MTWINYDDIVAQLRAADFEIGEIEVGKRKRVKVAGIRQKGWYQCHEITLDNMERAIVGSYGWWIGGEAFIHKFDLRVDDKKLILSAEQRAAFRARYEADKKRAEAERKREIERAAEQASRWWRKLNDAGESAYLNRKGFQPGKLYGARISPHGNLVVPMQDMTGKTYGLQVIYPKKTAKGRDKDFTPPGLAKKSHFFQIGLVQRGGIVLLCEGFATGASLREATGLPVIVAFDAGNLLPVALEIHKAHRKDVRILVCADDDHHSEAKTGRNTGRAAAEAAALAVDGAHTWPIFPGERSSDDKSQTDYNDLHVHPDGGLRMVAAQIEQAIRSAGWRTPAKPAPEADNSHQGGGDGGRAARSIMPLDELVERYVPLDDGTGKLIFDLWTSKIAQREQMIALLPAGVRGDDIKRHPTWIERGAYFLEEVGFDPSGADKRVKLNTWKGWPMQPKAGCCEAIKELLAYLCGEERITNWLLCWMAWPLQHPGAKMGSAVIMHGPQGTGKSVIFNRVLSTIYGDYATVLNQRGLEDRFNSDWMESKLYMCAEEVVARAEMWAVKNELKELVTGEWVRINPKNVAAYRQKNQVNVVYLSNEGQPLPIENDDRRHIVIYTPPKLSPEFYDGVFAEIEEGGVAAFYDYLLNLDINATYPGFHPKKHPPMTHAKQALIDLSEPSETRFIKDWLNGDSSLPVCPALATDVYASYLRWCRANGEMRPRPSNHFIGAVDRMRGWQKKKVEVYDSTDFLGDPKLKSVIFPPTDVLEAAGNAQPQGHSAKRWITEKTYFFKSSMHDEGAKWAG